MGIALVSGQNTALTGLQYVFDLTVGNPGTATLDASAILVDASGKARGDADFVFYNQPNHPTGAIRQVSGSRFDVDLAKLPAHVEKVVFVFTVEQGLSVLPQGYGFSLEGAGQQVTFHGQSGNRPEKSLMLMELYRRNGAWKVKAVDQGFAGGMGRLAEHFGIEVGESTPAATPPPAPKPAPQPAPKPTPAPAPAAKPINLSKITLEKKGETISLEKKSSSFGKIHVNLNWEQGNGKSGGLLKSLLGGGNSAIDLDLGCMYKLKNGKGGVVQALGNAFGNLEREPYIHLDGDDRSGQSSNGENLYLNGHHWSEIDRVMIFAFIYEGASNWAQANGRILLKAPDQPEVEVRLDAASGGNFCVIAMLNNQNGSLHIAKEVNYFPGHKQADKHYGFGFNWTAGRK